MATVTILYPSGPDFDLDYYLETHMPLVEEQWKHFGLQSYEIVVLVPGFQYQVQALLHWDTLSSWETASTDPRASVKVFGDIPNFTKAEPMVFKGTCRAEKSVQ